MRFVHRPRGRNHGFYLTIWLAFAPSLLSAQQSIPVTPVLRDHVVLGWNDLGMHCMNGDFSSLCVLPPFNNLWAQVIERGSPPRLLKDGIQLNYRFPENSYSAGKLNFWDYEDRLFGVDLVPNIGLTGNGLTGEMTWNGRAFEVTGVPLTPFNDATPTIEQPYQLAEVTVLDRLVNQILDQTTFVAPNSIEMHCDRCHSGGTISVSDNILRLHDEEEGTHLLRNKPVLCASCHASNALGTPGTREVPSLSEAIHGHHADEARNIDCYDCHPGSKTQCLRDIMFINGKKCQDCHGSIGQVASSIQAGRRPWLDEPKCGTCHPAFPENPNTLYRNSVGHGGLFCAACHNSPHAILPTVQPRDGLQALRVQGHVGTIKDCMVCHTVAPTGPGPHGITLANSVGEWKQFQ